MEEITVHKEELLERMQANRDKHREVFLAAMEGYRKHAQEVLEQHLADLLKGRTPEIRFAISRPEDHTRDYDRVIDMLKMHVDEFFSLNEQDFAQYVHDDWHWKAQWLKLSSTYAVGATQRAYGDQ